MCDESDTWINWKSDPQLEYPHIFPGNALWKGLQPDKVSALPKKHQTYQAPFYRGRGPGPSRHTADSRRSAFREHLYHQAKGSREDAVYKYWRGRESVY